MSYYNEMCIPFIDDGTVKELTFAMDIYEDEVGFENMLHLLNLPPEYVKTDSDNRQYVLFKSVTGAVDTLRPSDLDWNWYNRKTYYGDSDCFIFVKDLHNSVDWTKIKDREEYTRIEHLVSLYQSKLKKYGENLIIFPM